MVPIFRSLISIPAGVEKMNAWTFLLLTTRRQLHLELHLRLHRLPARRGLGPVEPYAEWFQRLVILAVVVVVVVFVVVRVRELRAES